MPVIISRAKLVFIDIEPDSFEINIEKIKLKITANTKRIISVPMWGYSTCTSELLQISKDYNVPIIEDTAQAIGTINKGKYSELFRIKLVCINNKIK